MREKGAALIVVLSFLILVGMISSTIVTISQKSSRKIKVETDRAVSSYLAEGATARLLWLMINDLQKNTKRDASQRFDKSSSDSSTSKYIATGRPISIHYYDATITARIFDMASGFNIAGSNGAQALQALIQAYSMSPAIVTNIRVFMDRFSDYISGIDGKSANGMSKADYTGMGLYPLPRSDQLQYRDEVLWIPSAGDLFTPDQFGRISELNIIPPQGMYFYVNKINFFSADKAMIMAQCAFSEEEANNIIEGRDNWLKGDSNLTIYNFIDTNYMMKLTQQFSFQDSGYYTLAITASQGEGSYERMMIISTKIGPISGNAIQYYEYLVY